MRCIRIPYYYLPDCQLKWLHRYTHILLETIRCIHTDEPHEWHRNETARHYQYYPSFLIWVHDKAAHEMVIREIGHRSPLSDGIRNLRSRSLRTFLPPSDIEIAEDVVYLLSTWKRGRLPGGKLILRSYVDLAEQIYGYRPSKAALTGVGEVSGPHRNSDAEWYHI